MTTSFPTDLDAFTNPTSSNPLGSPSHAGQHANANDAIEAIESVVGTTAAPGVPRLTTANTFTQDLTISKVSATRSQLQITDTTAGAGITIGGDTNLYRSAANVLKTDDSFVAEVTLTAGFPTGTRVVTDADGISHYWSTDTQPRFKLLRDAGGSPAPGLLFGPGGSTAPDTNLYRSAANTLKTDDSLTVAQTLETGGFINLGSGENRGQSRFPGTTSTTYDTYIPFTADNRVYFRNPAVIVDGELELNGALNHDGTTVGFYGTAPTTQQTGVAVSAAGIHAALVTLGLITA